MQRFPFATGTDDLIIDFSRIFPRFSTREFVAKILHVKSIESFHLVADWSHLFCDFIDWRIFQGLTMNGKLMVGSWLSIAYSV